MLMVAISSFSSLVMCDELPLVIYGMAGIGENPLRLKVDPCY